MVKKDKKPKSAEAKAQKAAKQSKKAAKSEKKVKSKNQEIDSDTEDVDLDAVLAAYAAEQTKFLEVTEVASPPPSPRTSSTIAASPSNRSEILVFGGEFENPDTRSVSFFNDLFTYQIHRHEWRKITSPNSPLPRSGHAWTRGGNTGGLYLFGGEFSSPKQGTFYHYNDFWHLDTSSREWTRLEPRKGKNASPPARSGHRMTYFKQYILLFGGFQDTSQTTKYLQDLWAYDTKENLWHEVKLPASTQRPEPRSSFSFLPHESGVVLYGGYSRQKTMSIASTKGKSGPSRNILKPVIHQDTWFVRISPPPTEAASEAPPTVRWERRKRPANAPNPPRAGATMAFHKSRGVLFGGVHDVEESEEGIDSEFFDQLFVWNVDRNRFFPLALRRPKAGGKQKQTAMRAKNRGKADEEELLANLAKLQTKESVAGAIDVGLEKVEAILDEEVGERKELLVRYEMPHRRFNAQLAVQDDTLFIFGGTFERGDLEFTFADMYTIDLGKLDGVREVFYEEPKDWNKQVEESDDDEDEDMEDDEDDSSSEDAMSLDSTPTTTRSEVSTLLTEPDISTEIETLTPLQADSRPYPRPFESLRDFFARTTDDWLRLILEKTPDATSEASIKEIRKKGFSQAEDRWWDCREEIRALEDEQEAAGISEVVSLADRGQEVGSGRRR